MPVRAYVWTPKVGHYGHASLELSDNTYISWWPEPTCSKVKSFFGSLPPDDERDIESDVRDEDGSPDKIYILPGHLNLDEEQIKIWWKNMKKENTWELFNNNCCRAVKCALSAGGLETEWNLVETPYGLINFFKYLCSEKYRGPRKKKVY